MKLKPIMMTAVIFYSLIFNVLGQDRIIGGKIIDATTQEPLLGVSVAFQGTSEGTYSNVNGEFTLTIPQNIEGTVVTVFSYIGYKTQTLAIERGNESTDLLIELEEDLVKLDEIVVTGQGIDISKRRLSTDVATVSAEELDQLPSNRLDQLLQAELPNVQIRLTGGQPGSASTVRSRGIVSAFTNSTPIVYVDGVRVDNLNTRANLGLNISGNPHQGAATSALTDIPVENIERIEFINGGAATTLYGSDAANGVIQIITKKGGKGRTNVNLNVEMGAITPTNDFLFWDRTADLLFQDGFVQNYSLGIDGGNDKFGYSFGGRFSESDGFRIHNQGESNKIDLRTGFQAKLNPFLTYRSSFGYVNQHFRRVRNGNAGGYTGMWFAEAGASLFTGPGFNNRLDENTPEEFAAIQEYASLAEKLQNNQTTVDRFQTSQVFEYKPIPALTIRATGGIDYRVSTETGIVTNEYLNHTRATPEESFTTTEGSISNFDRKFLGLTFELNGQHQAEVGEFSFISTLGGQFFRNEDQQIAYVGENVRDGAISINQAAIRTSDEFLSEVANYGVYFQENVGYKNRYFLEFGIRGDGNSAFGDDIGIQYFPKVGASYILSAEPWFNDEGLFSYVKLRGNYGVAGNFPTPFANERTIEFVGFLGEQAAIFGTPGNDDLRPEKTYTFEIGADIALFKERLSFGINYYNAETRDALFNVPQPPSNGEAAVALQNIGVIQNSGVEINANLVLVRNQDWDLRIGGSVNTLENEVTDAGGASPFSINGFSGRTVQIVVEEGSSVGVIRANRGTFENEVLVSTQGQSLLGPTLPDLFGSVNMALRYKSFNLFANADYQSGAVAHSFDRQFRYFYGAATEGIPQAEIDANGRSNWLNFTDRFVEPTDFFKVRVIGLTYDLPKTLVGDWARRVSVGFTVTNPINITNTSFDPEATQVGAAQGQGTATTGGINYSVVSQPRQWLGTLKVNF